MRRELLCTIDKNENCKNFNWIVLADEAITKRIPLMYEMSERYKAHNITKQQWSQLVIKELERNKKYEHWFSYEAFCRIDDYKMIESCIKEVFVITERLSEGYLFNLDILRAPWKVVEMIKHETSAIINVLVSYLEYLIVSSVENKGLCPQMDKMEITERLSVLKIVDNFRGDKLVYASLGNMTMTIEDFKKQYKYSTDFDFNAIGLYNDEDKINWAVALSTLDILQSSKQEEIEKVFSERLKKIIEEIMCEARDLNQTHYYSNVNIN